MFHNGQACVRSEGKSAAFAAFMPESDAFHAARFGRQQKEERKARLEFQQRRVNQIHKGHMNRLRYITTRLTSDYCSFI